jgi:hypothetical protein
LFLQAALQVDSCKALGSQILLLTTACAAGRQL